MKHFVLLLCICFIIPAPADNLTAGPAPVRSAVIAAGESASPAGSADRKLSRRQRKKLDTSEADTVSDILSELEEPDEVYAVEEEQEAIAGYWELPEPGAYYDVNAASLAGLEVWDDALPLNIADSPERLDSLVSSWYHESVSANYEEYFKQFIDLDSTATVAGELPDTVYRDRLRNLVSPVYLGYNDIVKRYIVAYTQTRKGTMARMIGLSMLYFPMIEQELAAAGVPLELRMLPVIESALNPVAVSRAGATGLWQFMYATGKHYGLEITSYIDQRRDPVASTRAACRYLSDLYGMYNDWTLALAAYSCGPGNVNKAIKRAGGNARTFWDIYDYLPRETRGYVPAFIGATYAFHYHIQHGIEPVYQPLPLAQDTIKIDRLMHLEQVSSTLGLDIETLRALNPQYKMDIIPAAGKTYELHLPQSEIARYIELESEIHARDTVYLAQYVRKDPVTNQQQFEINATEYRVKSGDTLGAIARRYGVTVAQLQRWNNITDPSRLRIGQRIEIQK
ncbi:MAG: transglycosylase SLT domain-containing protein [Alistipes sp.]|nr:transglycosylase SLT domain-containing protein [Alistipes sp.]